MSAFESVTSKTLVIDVENIDTDQIIPAQFLTTTTREGLGEKCFYYWRYSGVGIPKPDVTLNSVDMREHQVLVAGRNFGCGSSREHAPWALMDFGVKVVISSEIADIFRSNALKNGLLPVVIDEASHQWLLDHPGTEVTVNLRHQTVRFGNHQTTFQVEPFARKCLLNGLDQLGFLESQLDNIEIFEAAHA